MKLFIILLILFIPVNVYAERFICYHEITKDITHRLEGDCTTLEICDAKNSNQLQSNCFEVKENEWEDSLLSFKKVSPNATSGNRIIDMTLAEKTALQNLINSLIQQHDTLITNLKNKLKTLGLTNEEINFIINNL